MTTTNAPDLLSLAVAGKGTIFSIQTGNAAGSVTTATDVVTGVTGTPFVTDGSWDGETITIAGTPFIIDTVTSATSLTTTTPVGTNATAVAFTGPVTYTQVAEVKTLNFSGSKNDLEDVTSFDSEGRFKQYVATLADSGDCSINGNYITSDEGQGAFRAAFNDAPTLSFKIVLPLQAGQTVQGEQWVFNGIVSELDNGVQYDKIISFQSKVKCTGPITVIAGS